MKIWNITSEYPGEITSGGIARYVENMGKALEGRGVELTVITRARRNYHRQVAEGFSIIGFVPNYNRLISKDAEDSPIRASTFPYNLLAYWPALSFQVADLVESLIERMGPPDVIESQEYSALPYYLIQRKLIGEAALQNIPIIVHCHSPTFMLTEANHQSATTFPHYWVGEMEKFCISAADALLCPSNYLAEKIEQEITCKGKIRVIPLPGCGGGATLPALIASEKPIVLYFGRLEIRKGILKALETIETLWNSESDFRVVLVGGDTEHTARGTTVKAYIRLRYAHRIELGQLEMHESCAWEELQKHIASAQMVLVPSLWENFPNTCIEAMSLERVVLASTSGGQAELIGPDGKAGVLFDWEVPGDFATKFDQLLKISALERAQMGRAARKRVSEFCSSEKIVTQRLQHFEEVIKNHTKPTFFPAPWKDYALPTSLQHKDKDNAQLSVIIPYFNLGKYVREAVESVLRSTTPAQEILIVNDGSTEKENLSVLHELETQYSTLRVIHHPVNRGLAASRNTGAKEAKGNYIAFLDADDEVQPLFFEKTLRVLETYPNVGFVYSWVQFFENSRDIWPTWNAHFPYLLGHNMLVPICVVRKKAFLEVGGNNPQFEYNFEDYECWIHLLKKGWLGVSLPDCLTRYRVRSNSMFRSATEDQLRYLYNLLTQTHPDLYQRWGLHLAQLQASNGSSILWNHPARNGWEYRIGARVNQLGKSAIHYLFKLAPLRLLLRQPLILRTLQKIL